MKSRKRASARHRQALEQRRRGLLDATIAVIAREGITGITLSQIAAEAGCSYGVVSFHYKSKDRLLLAALNALLESYDLVLQKALSAAGPSPAARLAAVLEADFDRRVANKRKIAVWMAYWAEAPRNPAYQQRCASMKERYVSTVSEIIGEILLEKGMGADAEQVTRGLNAMIDGFWLYHQVAGSDPAKRERSREACMCYLRTLFPEEFGSKPRGVGRSRAERNAPLLSAN
jgi:TetR/AcrR family transcriptional regulator, transcriptional repressor of bet genes